MPTYKIAFTGGENPPLVIKAARFAIKNPNSILEFHSEDGSGAVVATVPIQNVLYIVDAKVDE